MTHVVVDRSAARAVVGMGTLHQRAGRTVRGHMWWWHLWWWH